MIVKGRVWRIAQIEEETGTIYIVPSEDPLAAIPGWDGEMIAVPFDLARQTGRMRRKLFEALKETGKAELAAETVEGEFALQKGALYETAKEIGDHIKQGAPLPTDDHIVVEAFDKYLILHACFGEIVNRTLGGIFDAVLSNLEVIVGWWNDGYRILIETRRKLAPQDLERLKEALFSLSDEEVEKAFNEYLEAKFPFSYKMKSVAERFGALPRGKTMGPERQGQLLHQFGKTPIYDETLREALIEKLDTEKAKEIIRSVHSGKIKVSTIYRVEKPTPLAYHILEKFSDVS